MEITKPSDQLIVLTRTFATSRQKLFQALTRPEDVPQWLQPKQMSLVSYQADFQAGGTFLYVFQRPSGARMEMRGVYREVDPPYRWVYSETYSFSPLALLVTIQLDEVPSGTLLSQTILYPSKEDRDGDLDPVASSSTDLYAKLDHFLIKSESPLKKENAG